MKIFHGNFGRRFFFSQELSGDILVEMFCGGEDFVGTFW